MKLYDTENGREQWHDPSTVDVYPWDEEPEWEPVCGDDELHDALKGLTARQRFVIELRYGLRDGETHSQEEVAGICGWHLSTVQEHEFRAEQKLYKLITGKTRRNTP